LNSSYVYRPDTEFCILFDRRKTEESIENNIRGCDLDVQRTVSPRSRILTSQPQSTNIRHPTHRLFAERNGLTNGCFRFRRTPLGLGAFTGKPNFGNNPTAHHLFCGNSSSLFYVCTVVGGVYCAGRSWNVFKLVLS
jgi:hypothetical protein